MSNQRKVAVVGLDCVPPELVFERWRNELPCLKSLQEEGWSARLESVIPPITVPAWSCMMSGKDPGELGIYGFRNRKDHTYDGLSIANSTAVREDRVWDILGRAGKQVILLAVPGTYPPRPVNGSLVSCFLTPSAQSEFTYPASLKVELTQKFGPYRLDVENFRSEEKERILEQIYRMTEQHFAMARHLLSTRPWDFFMMVEMGTDRLHHAFWKFCDPSHRKYEKGNRFENAMLDYYRVVDRHLAELRPLLGEETSVFVVSDHGAQKMEGGICVNEWLQQEGYLSLAQPVTEMTPLAQVKIDWSKTKAWGEGGYYCRIFLNVRGREPQGVIAPGEVEGVREELARKLEAMLDDRGEPLGTKVYKPEEIYHAVRGVPPDLIVLFGNLRWRSVGSLGLGRVHTFENDTGPDDANHSRHGIFLLREPGLGKRRLDDLNLLDVAPTILHRFGIPPPAGMHGRILSGD
ncbi:alkaline phosphatase family protein [Acidobacteriia bacterium AH_259_A11_L15]|nr:alkaline phosphatase family protein [Acidobacteriia bacterium AH_259_A11_L15]